MLFAPTFADKAILPTAWGGRYFFNRIGHKRPLTNHSVLGDAGYKSRHINIETMIETVGTSQSVSPQLVEAMQRYGLERVIGGGSGGAMFFLIVLYCIWGGVNGWPLLY